MVVVFFGLVVIMTLIMRQYYRYQNTRQSIGGKMSSAKAFWLGYALFNYFIFPIYLYFLFEEETLQTSMTIIIALFYFRMLIQGFLMFATRNWIPIYGIAYNIFSVAVVILILCFVWYGSHAFIDQLGSLLLTLVIFKLCLILVTDTYYAMKFQKIVGDETKGANAIWYASNEAKFDAINQTTTSNNKIFILISIIEIALLMAYVQS